MNNISLSKLALLFHHKIQKYIKNAQVVSTYSLTVIQTLSKEKEQTLLNSEPVLVCKNKKEESFDYQQPIYLIVKLLKQSPQEDKFNVMANSLQETSIKKIMKRFFIMSFSINDDQKMQFPILTSLKNQVKKRFNQMQIQRTVIHQVNAVITQSKTLR